MLRVVLDANVLVSALIKPKGVPGKIYDRYFKGHEFEMVISESIFGEYRRCLAYPRVRKFIPATEEEIEKYLATIIQFADLVEGRLEEEMDVPDRDDRKYLAAAIEGRANYLVSGDAQLLDLVECQGVRIVSPRAFLNMLI